MTFLKTKTDLDRLAQIGARAEAARRFQEERLASEARQREADAEPAAAQSPEYYQELYGCCLRCDGTGSLYVAGGASQEMVWSATGGSDSRGGWIMGTVHRSGTLETCHRCDGTGVR